MLQSTIRLSRSVISICSRLPREPPPCGSSCPFLSRNLIPSAAATPMPPSLVALPPMPTIIFLQPLSSAYFINSPVPKVEVIQGSFSCGLSNSSPDAAAISITADSPVPNIPIKESVIRIRGSCTFNLIILPPVASTNEATVPSPPSAMGTIFIAAPGITFSIPDAICSATSLAGRHSLKESGQINMRIVPKTDFC